MADIEYVDTTITTGSDDGTSWANAWRNVVTALGSALTSCNAGGTIYIKCDSVHQYSADITLLSTNGVSGNPVTIISVLETTTNEPPISGDFKTMMDGGGNLDTVTNGAYDINLSGWSVWHGIYFKSGDNCTIGTSTEETICINCKFETADDFTINPLYTTNGRGMKLYNCDLVHTTAGHIYVYGRLFWSGGSYSWSGSGAIHTYLFDSSTRSIEVIIENVDIQNGDSGDYLIDDGYQAMNILFKRCKIPTTLNYMNNGPTGAGCEVKFHSVDDGNNIHTFKEYYFEGQIESDTAVVRSATYDGTNKYSAKLVTAKGNTVVWSRPLRFKLTEIYCTANPTLKMHYNLDSTNIIQNNELWFEIEYPDVTTGALGKIDTSSRPANILITAANQGSSEGDPGGWTESFANPQARSKSVTISGGQAGVHTVWACLAKEATVYVCPKIEVS